MTKHSKTITEYQLHIQGVFGRNRKAKSHGVVVADCEQNGEVPADDLAQAIAEKIRELKVKPGAVWHLYVFPVTVEDMGDGLTVRGLTLTLAGHDPIMSGTV